MSTSLSYKQWYELRDLVLNASHDRKISTLSFPGYEEIVTLVDEYLKTLHEAPINAAAKKVAALCPGVSKEVANSSYWLVLEKS